MNTCIAVVIIVAVTYFVLFGLGVFTVWFWLHIF